MKFELKNRIFEENNLHILNPYKNCKPNFEYLYKKYPHLAQYLIKSFSDGTYYSYHIDWTNGVAVRTLTETLLKEDFNIEIEFMPDRLCPPLANRINYVCWLKELCNISQLCNKDPVVKVLDIGTGSVCIYPILGKKIFGWNFIASEPDPESIAWANKSLIKNSTLNDGIVLVHVNKTEMFQKLLVEKFIRIHFQSFEKKFHENKNKQYSCTSDLTNHTNQNNCKHIEDITDNSVKFETIKDVLIHHYSDHQADGRTLLHGPIIEALVKVNEDFAKIIKSHQKNFLHRIQYDELLGSEIPSDSLENKSKQEQNDKNESIVKKRKYSPLYECDASALQVDMVMCNPPFYDTCETIMACERSSCSGSDSEMRTAGGEVCCPATALRRLSLSLTARPSAGSLRLRADRRLGRAAG